MSAAVEPLSVRTVTVRASQLGRPVVLRGNLQRLLVDPDGAVRWMESLQEKRLLFGRGQVWFYKLQAGVTIAAKKTDWGIQLSPESATISGTLFEHVDVTQDLRMLQGIACGYSRRVSLKNAGSSEITIRLVGLSDPTAAQYRDDMFPWGSLGVNAFNRQSHVAMDEITEPPSARVIGAVPAPSRFYMTTERSRANDSVQRGEVPEAVAGASGQCIVLSVHDAILAPDEEKTFEFVSIYSAAKLEDALALFAEVQNGRARHISSERDFACSSPGVTHAYSWASTTAREAETLADFLDAADSIPGLSLLDADAALRAVLGLKLRIRKDGALPHSTEGQSPGVLETASYLYAASRLMVLGMDKKVARSEYAVLKRSANFLLSVSPGAVVRPDSAVPQGWRRRVGKGFPSGELPEVSLAVSAALAAVSRLARFLSKSSEASKFRERGEMVANRVRKALVDERGIPFSYAHPDGKTRVDDTIDMAVGCYRSRQTQDWGPVAHRALERDFETPYGARTVPSTNRSYFSGAYGHGQVGGYWTRAAIAHAILCYQSELTGTGGLLLEKVARLTTEDWNKTGGAPGEFPYWVDVETGKASGEGGDTVGSARFIEAAIQGEFGLTTDNDAAIISPPVSSAFTWVGARFWAGNSVDAFVGRGEGNALTFAKGVGKRSKCILFEVCRPVATTQADLHAVTFSGPGQVLCLGNMSKAAASATVSFPALDEKLTKKLTTPLEEFDMANGSWNNIGALRVNKEMSVRISLGPSGWKAFRVSAY